MESCNSLSIKGLDTISPLPTPLGNIQNPTNNNQMPDFIALNGEAYALIDDLDLNLTSVSLDDEEDIPYFECI